MFLFLFGCEEFWGLMKTDPERTKLDWLIKVHYKRLWSCVSIGLSREIVIETLRHFQLIKSNLILRSLLAQQNLMSERDNKGVRILFDSWETLFETSFNRIIGKGRIRGNVVVLDKEQSECIHSLLILHPHPSGLIFMRIHGL